MPKNNVAINIKYWLEIPFLTRTYINEANKTISSLPYIKLTILYKGLFKCNANTYVLATHYQNDKPRHQHDFCRLYNFSTPFF